jgi:hypothetical protein
LKVEPAIAVERVPNVGAIRIFAGQTGLEIDSTTERGHHPSLLVKKIRRESTGRVEIEIVMKGDYHVEPLSYYKTKPETWSTFGEIYLTPAQATELADKIKIVVKARADESTQTLLVHVQDMVVSRQTLTEMFRLMLASRSRSHSRAPSRRRRR